MHRFRWTAPLVLATATLASAQPAAPVGDLPVPPHALPSQPLQASGDAPGLSGSASADAGQGQAGAADAAAQPAPRHALALHARVSPPRPKSAPPR